MKKIVLGAALLASLSIGVGIGSQALGAPRAPKDPPLDLELREAPAGEVLRLVGEVQGKRVEVDACVTAKIDVKLKNVPASVVESALVHKLGLTLVRRDDVTFVGCAARPAGG